MDASEIETKGWQVHTRYDLARDETVLTAEITFRHVVRFPRPPDFDETMDHVRQREYALKQFVSCMEVP